MYWSNPIETLITYLTIENNHLNSACRTLVLVRFVMLPCIVWYCVVLNNIAR